MGLAPVNCRKVMTACIQSVAMFGSELWWKGDRVEGTIRRAEETQVVVNKQARAVTGCFQTTNLGALAMESGLRPATAQLENRQRRFGLRLLSLPDGDQAREVVGTRTGIGRRLKNALALAHRGRTETTVLLMDPEALDAETILEDEKTAKVEAERIRPGLTMFTDGSRLDSGATGYAVAWQNGQSWVGIKTHMGNNQEAYDAECAALARALETAAKRRSGKRYQQESPPSAMPKPPSDEWHRRSQVRARSTRSWRESILPYYGVPDRTSPLKSDGVPPTRASPGMRKPTSGRSSRQKTLMRAE
jgi:hypothetical protein